MRENEFNWPEFVLLHVEVVRPASASSGWTNFVHIRGSLNFFSSLTLYKRTFFQQLSSNFGLNLGLVAALKATEVVQLSC